MNALTLSQIADLAEGKVVSGDPETVVSRVVTDSRKVMPGDLFVALRGEQHDAHNFVANLAVPALVDRLPAYFAPGAVLVEDTSQGLQTLARNYRKTLAAKIVAITGSNGKTSTKDLTAMVLGSRLRVVKTQGNLNNHIGLPLSVLSIDSGHQAAILEMGMNHPGEIAPLAAIASPDAAIITNIGIAHIEFMGSREAIALEKGMLARMVGEQGTVILNADDDFTESIACYCKAEVITAGIENGQIRAENLIPSPGGSRFRIDNIDAFLPVPGRHMVANAVLAVAAGVALGIPLRDCVAALANVQLTGGRLQARDIAGIHFIDDTYNANPDSMTAALTTLASLPGRRIAVLGHMGELGSFAVEGHRIVGKAAVISGLDLLIVVGEAAEWIAREADKGAFPVLRAADTSEAAFMLSERTREGDNILVKGSRSARMERVIENFEPHTTAR
ncbi:MAG TPA: UDP-N-acetylmuramoyl-tripeptide--D-alanyl-D-alanine ligase [Chthoniobacterales bacterium]